jgi:hypothetical protein
VLPPPPVSGPPTPIGLKREGRRASIFAKQQS